MVSPIINVSERIYGKYTAKSIIFNLKLTLDLEQKIQEKFEWKKTLIKKRRKFKQKYAIFSQKKDNKL